MELQPTDDFFHEPTNDERWWSETYWFSFDDPVSNLSATFYPLLRRNLDIAALTVAVWAPDQSTVWEAPYYRSYWHLKPPEFSGNAMELEGLRYEILEPLNKYRVSYDDPGVFSADLTVTGITDNHVIVAVPDAGHWDQPSRVAGTLNFRGNTVEIDCFGMRDRSWGPRLDSNSARASYVYGINADSSFLVVSQLTQDPPAVRGYIEIEGTRSGIASAEVAVTTDELNRVSNVQINAQDELGRSMTTNGIPRNHIAKQASPGYFAWMSMIEWDFPDGAYGEFQDVWSPDRLSELGVAKAGL